MNWAFCVTIERQTETGAETEKNYVLAECIEDVMQDYRLDSLDESCEIVAIERLIPIVRSILPYTSRARRDDDDR